MNENIADLRAVAVRDDYFIFISEGGDRFADFDGDFLLGFGGGFAVFL